MLTARPSETAGSDCTQHDGSSLSRNFVLGIGPRKENKPTFCRKRPEEANLQISTLLLRAELVKVPLGVMKMSKTLPDVTDV